MCNEHFFRVSHLSLILILVMLRPLSAQAEITFNFQPIGYGNCGNVSINGGAWEDGQPITDIDWDWDDGVAFNRQFPAAHQYELDGTYEVSVTFHGHTGASRTEILGVEVSNAELPGCEVIRTHLELGEPQYSSCGRVSINGGVWSELGSITHLSWDWDDGSVNNSFFPATHEYTANGNYLVSVTAFTDGGDSRTETVTADIGNAEVDGCDLTLRIHPEVVYLRDGKTNEQLRLEIRDGDRRPVDPRTVQVEWTSNEKVAIEMAFGRCGDL